MNWPMTYFDTKNKMKTEFPKYVLRNFQESLPTFPALVDEGKRILLQTNEVITKFKTSVTYDSIKRILEHIGAKIVRPIDFSPNTYLISVDTSVDAVEISKYLIEDGLAEFSHPNFIENIPLRTVIEERNNKVNNTPPNDLYPLQWHLHEIKALDTWQVTRG